MELILGTAQLDGSYGVTRSSEADPPEELLSAAWTLGFQTLDTARSYTGVESVIGNAGWAGRIHTKIAADLDVEESLNKSLSALKRKTLDVVYHHNPSLVETYPELLDEARKKIVPKLAGKMGVSVYTPSEFTKAVALDSVDVIQAPMSIIDCRISEKMIQSAVLRGKSVYARSVFLQGIVLADPLRLPQRLEELAPVVTSVRALAQDFKMTPVELAVRWVLSLRGISGIVIGGESIAQLTEIAAAVSRGPLDPNLIRRVHGLRRVEGSLVDPRQWRISQA